MHKKFLVIAFSLFFIMTIGIGSAFATGKSCPPGQEKKGWKCVDIEPTGTNVTNENKNTLTNNVGNTLLGDTFSPKATAKGGDGGNATVKNSGNSENKNTNLNTNLNTNKADAKSNSKATSIQGQSSKNVNVITIEGDDVDVEADKREHIQGPGLLNGDAKVVDTKASNARAMGGLFEHVDFLTMKQAKMASKNASDMDVETALIMENDFQTTTINMGKAGDFAGHIYIFSDGSDSYLSAMDAEASEVAMKAGLTHIRRLGKVETSKHLVGSAWNIGIGGGASIMTAGEDIALAPNGGAGYGKAKSSSQMRPDAVYEVSFAKELIGDLKTSKSTSKYTYTVADR